MSILSARSGPLAAYALVLACVSGARSPTDDGSVVLGTFDSRAVAVAYANSPAFEAVLAGLRQELEEARAAGDEARVAELEARGPEMQRRLHLQGFSTGSVDDILAHLEDELPAIAERAGVDAMVSRWDLVYARPEATFVDVTELLVDALDPDDRGRRWALEIVESDPVPPEELDRLDH